MTYWSYNTYWSYMTDRPYITYKTYMTYWTYSSFSRHHGNLFEIVALDLKKIGCPALQVPLWVKGDRKAQDTLVIFYFMQIIHNFFAGNIAVGCGLVDGRQ